MAFTVQMLL